MLMIVVVDVVRLIVRVLRLLAGAVIVCKGKEDGRQFKHVPQEKAAGRQEQLVEQPQGEPVHHYHSHNAFIGRIPFCRLSHLIRAAMKYK